MVKTPVAVTCAIMCGIIGFLAGQATQTAPQLMEHGVHSTTAKMAAPTEDPTAMNAFLSRCSDWYDLQEMLERVGKGNGLDLHLHSTAVAASKFRPDDTTVWECWASSGNYSIPIIAGYSNEAGDSWYRIVCGTAFHSGGEPVQYEPKLVIYYSSKGGSAIRIDEKGRVWRQVGTEQRWALTDDQDDQDLVKRIREETRKVVLKS